MKNYSLTDFDFALPEALIAQQPAHPRDHARLLVYDRTTKQITDDYFYNIETYLPANTTLVVNNSKVEKCRFRFGAMELFVTETHNPTTITAMVRPGKKFKPGNKLALTADITANVLSETPEGLRIIELSVPINDKRMLPFALTPLPPYIAQNESLAEEYQTVYADPLGSKAAPTAGLHFTKELLNKIKQNHTVSEITLHVGLGTFAPVKTENLHEHHMHSEWYEISKQAAAELSAAKHITAVGTTSVRTLESAVQVGRHFEAGSNDTAIFITPGYTFQAVDALITNFHLPKSTLLMLVSALIGSVDELQRLYAHAIDQGYRFYSFGDAMLII